MNNTHTEHEREAFEAWAFPAPYNRGLDIRKHPNGDYIFRRTQAAWEAWQAARTSYARVRELEDAITEYRTTLQDYANDGDLPYKIAHDEAEEKLDALLSTLPTQEKQ